MAKIISTNPSRNYEVIGEVECSTEKEVKDIVAKAHQAQSKWATLSLEERVEKVKTFGEAAGRYKKEIIRLIATETGRPVSNESGNTDSALKYLLEYEEIAKDALKTIITLETDTEIHQVYREPWGVVATICPWNFPFMNVVWQCIPAILCGNTIVYKNSEENPLFAKLIEKIVNESEIPDGVFNVVYGDGQVGEWLVNSDIDMISFTGSKNTGQRLTRIAAEKFIPILTELGGSSPCVVFEDIEVTDELTEFIFTKRFVHSGQICCAIKRLIVHESKFDEIIEKLVKIAQSKKIGDASDESTDLGPLVAERQTKLIEEQVQDAIKKGAKVHCGGKRPEGLKGAYFLPTILTNINFDMRVWREETFGPVLPIVSFKTEDEALKLANDTEYGLGAYVMTDNKERFDRLARKIESGMVSQNQVNFFGSRNPFGGYKKSGMGREKGEFVFHEFTQIKLVGKEK